jgi:hypothetical protein
MSNKSRRVKLAAGAILAGAAIPIAAAGAAWGDPDATTTDTTEGYAKLIAQGLSPTEAADVVKAEHGTTTPVEVSYNGTVVVDANNSSNDATAFSEYVGTKNVAAAIGDGALASDGAGDSNDRAFANGANDRAIIDFTADGKATANGASSTAEVEGANTTQAGEVTNSSATATNGGYAKVENDTLSSVTSVEHDHAIASGPGSAGVYDASSSDAAERNAGESAGATVEIATKSDAYASGLGSVGEVMGTPSSPIGGSSEVTTNGNSYTVSTSDTHDFNGAPIGSTDVGADASAVHVPLLP